LLVLAEEAGVISPLRLLFFVSPEDEAVLVAV
jgi:hypothetical protein